MRRLPILALTIMAVACAGALRTGRVTFATQMGGRATLDVRIAETASAREKGLSGVRDLPKDSGMAFLYSDPTTDRFWMKDTLIPLSIAFIADGKVIAIDDMMPCAADPCRTYVAPEPFTAAIEAPVGWYRTQHITVGASVTIGGAS